MEAFDFEPRFLSRTLEGNYITSCKWNIALFSIRVLYTEAPLRANINC